jgi:hypothetical protein
MRFALAGLKFFCTAPDSGNMVNSISSAQSSYASEAAQSTILKPQQQAQQQESSPLPSDTVTLKSTGSGDQNGQST